MKPVTAGNTPQPSSKMKSFTPGPWRVGPYYRHEVLSDAGVICCAPIETEQTRTNARLIAAAPELLQALEAMLDAHPVMTGYYESLTTPLSEGEQRNFDALRKADSAIRAAKGESQ